MTEFVLAESDRYWWPVEVRVPDPENAGKIIVQEFEMQFEPLGRSEAIKQQKIYEALTDPQERVDHEHEQLRNVCKNWRSRKDPTKQPAPFTEENFNKALEKAWFRTGVYRALNDSQWGDEVRLGN